MKRNRNWLYLKETSHTDIPHIQILMCTPTRISIYFVTSHQSTTFASVTTYWYFQVRKNGKCVRMAFSCAYDCMWTHTSRGSSVVSALNFDDCVNWTWNCWRTVFANYFLDRHYGAEGREGDCFRINTFILYILYFIYFYDWLHTYGSHFLNSKKSEWVSKWFE